MTTSLFATLRYADADAAMSFLEGLGFEQLAVFRDDTAVSHAEYRWGRHGGIMFGSAPEEESQIGAGSVYCVVESDDDVDVIHATAIDLGGASVQAPMDPDYGGRTATIADPEGNVFSFGSYRGATPHAETALRPRLIVNDADGAMAFYERAFDAVVQARHATRNMVVSAQLTLLGIGIEIQVKDVDDHDTPPAGTAPSVILELTVADPDAVFDQAVEAGATVRFPMRDMPYGKRQGRLADPYGHQWLMTSALTRSSAEIDHAHQ